jgi:hypothetical protein
MRIFVTKVLASATVVSKRTTGSRERVRINWAARYLGPYARNSLQPACAQASSANVWLLFEANNHGVRVRKMPARQRQPPDGGDTSAAAAPPATLAGDAHEGDGKDGARCSARLILNRADVRRKTQRNPQTLKIKI